MSWGEEDMDTPLQALSTQQCPASRMRPCVRSFASMRAAHHIWHRVILANFSNNNMPCDIPSCCTTSPLFTSDHPYNDNGPKQLRVVLLGVTCSSVVFLQTNKTKR